jgi:hypothetical protein
MNYYGPRQRQSDGRWDYTCKNDNRIWPIGYCRAHRVWTVEDLVLSYSSPEYAQREADKLNAKYGPLAGKFHTGGHTTADEACRCYREYLLDTDLEFSTRPDPDTQKPCAVCGQWTQHAGWLRGGLHVWHLCEKHQTRADVEKLFGSVGEIYSSY